MPTPKTPPVTVNLRTTRSTGRMIVLPEGSPDSVEYVHAGELRKALQGHPLSELWGDVGLLAATMRCVEALDRIEELVVDAAGSAEETVAAVQKVLQGDRNHGAGKQSR